MWDFMEAARLFAVWGGVNTVKFDLGCHKKKRLVVLLVSVTVITKRDRDVSFLRYATQCLVCKRKFPKSTGGGF